ncbi:hypothetical protein [Actinomadura sp. 9N215]|uniref:hypothetical protein n=1 Tax=Actinomadura sp. 9N215 TaxID=3375150 RepID=UPI003796EA4D
MTSRKDIDQLIGRINATPGFVVPEERTSKCHRRAFRADANGRPVGRGVTLPGTPGDYNQLHTTRRKLRRNLGWHDPLAKTNQQRRKKKKRRGKDVTEPMPQVSDVARLVRFDDGAAVREARAGETPAQPPAGSAGTSTPATVAQSSASVPTSPSAAPSTDDRPERPQVTTGSVRDVARYMHWHLQQKAAQNPDNRTTNKGATGWQWVGRLGDEMTDVYPELQGLDKRQFTYLLNRVRSILTADGRLVSVKAGNPVVPSVYFVKEQAIQRADAAPAVISAPAAPPAAPPVDSASTGASVTPQDITPRGHKGVNPTAADLTRNDAQNPKRISVEDVLGFLGEHETMLKERDELEPLAVEVAELSDQLNRAATALIAKLRGRRDGSP